MNEEIKYRYFIAEGAKVESILAAGQILKTEAVERNSTCIQKYGADCTWGGAHESPRAVGFAHNGNDKPVMREGFLKPKVERCGDGKYAVYYPDKRYKSGKAIKQDLDAVGRYHFGDYITGKLGVDISVFGISNGRMVRATTWAGLYGETLVLRIPTGGDTRPRDFVVPPTLREIKKSEFIAITEEGE